MLRDLIPAKIRLYLYAGLGALVAVNGVIGVLDDGVIAKIVEVAAVLGFGLAAANVPAQRDAA